LAQFTYQPRKTLMVIFKMVYCTLNLALYYQFRFLSFLVGNRYMTIQEPTWSTVNG